MKKTLGLLFLSLVLLAALPALDVNINIGLLSGAGVSQDVGRWQFGADFEMPFPVLCITDGIAGIMFNDLTFWEGFKLGLTDFFGADLYTYFRLLGNSGCSLYAGLYFMLGSEPLVRSFEAGLRPTVKLSFRLNEKTSFFMAGGFTQLSMTYVPGFSKPLVKIPKVDWFTVLPGCRIGTAISIN